MNYSSFWQVHVLYEEAAIRNYYNVTMVEKLFHFGKGKVSEYMTVNNNKESTDSPDNPYCHTSASDYRLTNQTLYPLSYQDMINADYGFPTSAGASSGRKGVSTDYAIAKSSVAKDVFWTRSPCSTGGNKVWAVASDGSLVGKAVTTSVGVRPACRLIIS